MSALLSIYAAPAEPKKKGHLVPSTEGAVFLPLASWLQFIFASFIFLGERLFANIIAKWGTGGQAKSLLSSNPPSPFWMWAPTVTAAPPSILMYATTPFHSVFSVCQIQRAFDNFPFPHCPLPQLSAFFSIADVALFLCFVFFSQPTLLALQDAISITRTLSSVVRSGAAQARRHIIEIICEAAGEPRYSWNWIAGCCFCFLCCCCF